MVGSEYSPDNYKCWKISIGAIIKYPQMLRFALDQLTTKMMYKHAVKKLPFVTIYAPDRYKTEEIEEMCDKSILENGGALESVVDCYKNQKMYNKAVDNYAHAIEFCPQLL